MGKVLQLKTTTLLLFLWLVIAKTDPKKLVALIRSIKFLSPEVALYLMATDGILLPCLGWSSWAGHLEMLDKLEKGICRTVGPLVALSLSLSLSLSLLTVSFLAQLDFGALSLELADLF